MESRKAVDNGQAPRLKPLRSNSPSTQYLLLYNFVSALLWLVVLGRLVLLVPLVGFGTVYRGVGQFTKWTQTVAVLEIAHAAFGVVRAPVGTTSMQVASRLLLVWGIINNFPFLAKSTAFSTMLLAWSVTEICFLGPLSTGDFERVLPYMDGYGASGED
ncbi:hypothetical protein B7494_g4825 [Chlorociboria aeruginascens]|nr:hypothetical protein B7494_g4825 [Chlorociboria aeruginascens]